MTRPLIRHASTGYAYNCDECDGGLWASSLREADRAARDHAAAYGHHTDVSRVLRHYSQPADFPDEAPNATGNER